MDREQIMSCLQSLRTEYGDKPLMSKLTLGECCLIAIEIEALSRTEATTVAGREVERLRVALAADFRNRARLCRINMDAFDEKAAAVWDLAAEAVDAA